MATLPYTTSPGNIEKALNGIKTAATPERVTQDFVKTILKIPGGSGDQITAFLRKIGFVNADGTPSDLYKRFRNNATSGNAAAEALKVGYAPLYRRNEFMHMLGNDELRGIIVEETGAGDDSAVSDLVLSSIQGIKKFAKFEPNGSDTKPETQSEAVAIRNSPPKVEIAAHSRRLGMNLSYTINLNLPATSDIAVFNAIFKSLKDNLLRDTNEE